MPKLGREACVKLEAALTNCPSEEKKSNTFWPLKQEKNTTKQIEKTQRELSPRGVKRNWKGQDH